MTNIVNVASSATSRPQESKELTRKGDRPKTAVAENSLPIKVDEALARPARSNCCCH